MASFFSPYSHEFVRLGACVPHVAAADPRQNADNVLGLLALGDKARIALMVFPELGISAYAIDDLLLQDALLDQVERQLDRLISASRDLFPVFAVGAPLRHRGHLYNCGVVIHRGRRSGRCYRTPVNVFPAGDGYVFALTYGPDTDWVKNALAAGGCELQTRGRTIRLASPRVYRDEDRRGIRPLERQVLRVLNVADFLSAQPAPAGHPG